MSTLIGSAGDRPQASSPISPRLTARERRLDYLLLAAFCGLTLAAGIVFAHDGPGQTSKGPRTGDPAPVVRAIDE
jgi:hypothetical protein